MSISLSTKTSEENTNKSIVKGKSPVITIKDLNGQHIAITKLKFNKNKQATAGYINIKEKPAIAVHFETSILSINFDPKYYGEDDDKKVIPEENRQYQIVVRAHGGSYEVPEDTEIMIKFLNDLVDKTLEYGIENSKEITKKKYDISQKEFFKEAYFSSPVKQGTKPDGTLYRLQFNLKIAKDKETNTIPELILFKDSNVPIKIESWSHFQSLCPKNTPCKAIVKPILSFVNNKMFITFRIVQLKLYTVERATMPKTYAFSDEPVQLTRQIESLKIEEKSNSKTDSQVDSQTEEFIPDSEENSEIEVDVDEDA
jgi:hypothetical protein